MSDAAKINPSLQKKSAARIAAVQSLYQLAMTHAKSNPEKQVASLKAQLKDNRDEQKLLAGVAMEPDYALLTKLLTGVAERHDDIEKRLGETLSDDWTRDRMSKLLIAILQCAIFELFFHKDTKPNIIIDEYTRLARSFFAEGEVDFVYAALSKLAQQYAK